MLNLNKQTKRNLNLNQRAKFKNFYMTCNAHIIVQNCSSTHRIVSYRKHQRQRAQAHADIKIII